MSFMPQRLVLSKTLFNQALKLNTTRCLSYKVNRIKNEYKGTNSNWNFSYKSVLIASTIVGYVGYGVYKKKRNVYLEDLSSAGKYKENLPKYTMEEVNKHATKETGIWVTYKQGVYDITNFINEHPGGDQILMAAGSSIEPFWLLYGIHKTPQIYKILEEMRIGNISEDETRFVIQDMDDPYSGEPLRHTVLKPASEKPYNAEPPSTLLVEHFLTPNEIFYVRNHLPVPYVDPETYELEIEVDNGTNNIKKTLKLEDLKKLPKHTINATIMCAGNRRSEMNRIKEVKGLSWGQASVGNAQWGGARLSDVLKLVGITDESQGYQHIQFEGLDVNTSNVPYGASIPFLKGTDRRGDVILAYEMNGQVLPRDHGFPIRVVVPGTVGARNVKWLSKIIVTQNESESHWQQFDYKGFSPSTTYDNIDWNSSPAIQELPVISAICKPIENEIVKVDDDGMITVRGYAWSGGGKKIVRVDVTIDGGENWYVAGFDHQEEAVPPHHWAWTLWTVKVPVENKSGNIEVWAKAVDSSYNTQPESFKNIWNLRGVLNNAYHKIKIQLK
nr:probable sulfite oxidase, mitochondrial [Onthophagus taurus]